MAGLDTDAETAQPPRGNWKMGKMQLILQVLVKEVNFRSEQATLELLTGFLKITT